MVDDKNRNSFFLEGVAVTLYLQLLTSDTINTFPAKISYYVSPLTERWGHVALPLSALSLRPVSFISASANMRH